MDPFSTTFERESPARLPLSPQAQRAPPLTLNSEMISVPDLLLVPLSKLQSKEDSRSSGEELLQQQAGISENRTAVDVTLQQLEEEIQSQSALKGNIPPPLPILPKQMPDFEAPKCPLDHINFM